MPISKPTSPLFDALRQPLGVHIVLFQKELAAKSEHLLAHSVSTAELAKYLVEHTGEAFKITPHQAFISGLTHDVGKLYVSDEILDKNGPLSDRDWDSVKQHPSCGASHLSGTVFRAYGAIALSHHETPDGGGYPCGVKGPNLPNNVRLIAFADRLAALMEDRPYRARIVNFGALCKELRRTADIYFAGDLKRQVIEHSLAYVGTWLDAQKKVVTYPRKADRATRGVCREVELGGPCDGEELCMEKTSAELYASAKSSEGPAPERLAA